MARPSPGKGTLTRHWALVKRQRGPPPGIEAPGGLKGDLAARGGVSCCFEAAESRLDMCPANSVRSHTRCFRVRRLQGTLSCPRGPRPEANP